MGAAGAEPPRPGDEMRARSVGAAAAAAALMAAGGAAGQTAPAAPAAAPAPPATSPRPPPLRRPRPAPNPSHAQDARDQQLDRQDETATEVSGVTVQAARPDPTRMYGAVVGD